jgi:hypothetical protein
MSDSERDIRIRQLQGQVPGRGSGSPEGVRVGSPGDLYVDTDGGAGTTFWVKETGVNTDTGWDAK